MDRQRIETEVQSRIESFGAELAELVKGAVIRTVEEALGGHALASPRVPRGRARSERTPETAQVATDKPVSLELYERMAIQRALAERGGDAIAAAKLLEIGKSTFYRKMKRLGVELPRVARRRGNHARLQT